MKTDFSRVGKATLERIEKGILPGATVCIHRDGRLVYEFTGGYSDKEKGIPLRHDALFRLCSMTKPITATAVLWAQDHGLLSVGDRVADYLPEFADRYVLRNESGKEIYEKAARDITIEDILTHTSGLGSGPNHDAFFDTELRKKATTLAQMVPSYTKMPLDFTPGSTQFYSALVALDLAARIVEIVTDTDYESFLRKNILLPLGMKDTGYTLTPAQQSRLVTLYRLSDGGDCIERKEVPSGHEGFPQGGVSGATALCGTRDDYARFAQMLCNEGELDGVRILSKQAVRSMRTPRAKMAEHLSWGYTVMVRESTVPDVQELTAGSFGWSGAYSTHFWVDPELRLTCVYMANMDNAGGSGAITASECECNVMRSLKN